MPPLDQAEQAPGDPALSLSLVQDDPPFRVLRGVGLIPATGLGLVRRAIFFALLSWLPIAIWSWTAGRAISEAAGEPLLQHFGVHVRCLVAIPILILAQGLAHSITTHLLPWFVKSGVITPDKVPAFREVVHGMLALRNHTLPWVMIAGVVIVVGATGPMLKQMDELSWALDTTKSPPEFGFGGWWFLLVARPIYAALVLGWLWRVVLLTVLFYRITSSVSSSCRRIPTALAASVSSSISPRCSFPSSSSCRRPSDRTGRTTCCTTTWTSRRCGCRSSSSWS
jgi:hypothetical protein